MACKADFFDVCCAALRCETGETEAQGPSNCQAVTALRVAQGMLEICTGTILAAKLWLWCKTVTATSVALVVHRAQL